MTGFREQLFNDALEILERHINDGAALTRGEGQTLRQLWECSKVGNLLVQAVDEVAPWAFDRSGIARMLRNAPGFLSSREVWYSQRLINRVVTAYRGANREEIDPEKGELGMSWTTDLRVAHFFARRAQNGVVLQAKVCATCWLETAESELIVSEPYGAEIVTMPEDVAPIKSADWDNIKPIPPNLRGAPHRSTLWAK